MRSPGSWQGGSWVSALLVVCFAEHLRGILLGGLWLVVLFVYVQDPLIRWHLMQLLFGAVMPCSSSRCVLFMLFWVVGVWLVLVFLLVLLYGTDSTW